MSTVAWPLSSPFDILHEPAVAAAPFAPRDSDALLALLDRGPDRGNGRVAAILATLAAIRSRLLEADSPEAAELWEEFQSTSNELRGGLIDALRAAPADRQERAIDYLRELATSEAGSFAALRGPLDGPELLVAVAGDFKRGKSTLINALLGWRALPTRVAPATAVPCVLRAAARLSARVYFVGDAPPEDIAIEDLEQYACIVLPGNEEGELAYRADVRRVELGIPDVLPANVTIIDLPGLNEEQGRTDMAREAVARADAVIVVLAANQLLAEDELQFIETLWSRGYRSLIYVVNFIDGLEEHEIRTVRERSSVLLAPYGGSFGKTIFLVSARQALLARVAGDTPPPESGVPALEAVLQARLVDRADATWRISRLRQVLEKLESEEQATGTAVLRQQQSVRRLRSERDGLASRLLTAERIYGEGDLATAHDMAMRRQRIVDHDTLYEGRWSAFETDLKDRFKREGLPWVWQRAGDWVRDEIIRAIREVHPQVSPRPEGYLRISVAPGLRVGRDGLFTFYRGEAEREWERFTAEARAARKRELEEALVVAEREHRRLQENRETTWAPLEARRQVLATALEASTSAANESLQRAIMAGEALRVALEALTF